MKRLPLLLLVVCFTMTSCLKDGFKDFEAFDHDWVIEGDVNPSLGIPIGCGSASIHDLLSMFQETESFVEVDDNGLITLSYSVDTLISIDVEDSKKPAKGSSKDGDIAHCSRYPFSGSYPVDLFENMHIFDTTDIEVDSILVNLASDIIAIAKPNAQQEFEKYHVHIYFDSLYINIKGQDGLIYQVYFNNNRISIDTILTGEHIVLFDNTDISVAVNKRITELYYGGCLNVAFESEFFGTTISDNQFVADSIGITRFDIDAHLDLRFPISAYIDNLAYETDINVNSSFEAKDFTVDSSHLYFDFYNGIPFALNISAKLIDSLDNEMCNIIQDNTIINGAKIGRNPNIPGRYIAVDTTNSRVDILVDRVVWDALQRTRKVHVKVRMSTSRTSGIDRPLVAIRDSDKLDFKLWGLIKPNIPLNYDLTGSNDSKKGGLK